MLEHLAQERIRDEEPNAPKTIQDRLGVRDVSDGLRTGDDREGSHHVELEQLGATTGGTVVENDADPGVGDGVGEYLRLAVPELPRGHARIGGNVFDDLVRPPTPGRRDGTVLRGNFREDGARNAHRGGDGGQEIEPIDLSEGDQR